MKKQLVHIKGTKEGLVLRLDDQCAYAELVEELELKFLKVALTVKSMCNLHLGNRYCTPEQKKELIGIVERQRNFLYQKSIAM